VIRQPVNFFSNTLFMEVDDLKEKATGLAENVEDLANTFYRLTLLNLTQKTSNLAAGMIVGIAVAILAFIVLLFAGIAVSWWLGDLLDNRVAGFLLGAGTFLIILLIMVLFKKQIISPLRDLIIRKIYD
jgi:hypothetical protein